MGNKRWRNWSGSVQFRPQTIQYPRTEEEIIALVQQANQQRKKIRVAGSGHSFTRLVKTPDVVISLDHLSGLVEVNQKQCQATIWAGTKLFVLGPILAKRQLSMQNLGDISQQALGGAISTGTHGTGISLGNISTQVLELTLITGTGELVTCSANNQQELFQAAQVSLGSLGIITRVKLQLEPLYRLKSVIKREKLLPCLEQIDKTIQTNRHFEFYFFPYTNTISTKYLNKTTKPTTPVGFTQILDAYILENGGWGIFCELTRLNPAWCKPISQISASLISESSKINTSYRIFANPRLVRFNEMEYAVKSKEGPEVILAIKKLIEKEKIQVQFPIEYRYLHHDNIYLSQAYKQDSACISVHMYHKMPYKKYFEGCEKIFKQYDGRPHWGKLHSLNANTLEERYPAWHKFQQIREEVDPNGIFFSKYLRRLFSS